MHVPIRKVHNSVWEWSARWDTSGLHPGAPGLIRRLPRSGFTLIEMAGVLAVIAILAAILIPKVFEAIHRARVVHAAMGIGTAKTTLVTHVAKFGSLAIDGSVSPPAIVALDGTDARASDFDLVLVQEGLLDAPFAVRIGFGYLELTGNEAVDLDALRRFYADKIGKCPQYQGEIRFVH